MATIPFRSDDTAGARSLNSRLLAYASRILARIPPRTGSAIANGLSWAHWAFFPSRRRAVVANLRVMLPDATPRERRRMTRRMMASYNRMLFEFFQLPALPGARLLDTCEITGLEHIARARDAGRGVILTSSHIGNWELGAVALAHVGHRVHAVAGVQLSRWLSPAVRDAKQSLTVFTIAPEDGFRKLFRALAGNDIVALMVDGGIFFQGAPVPFFGQLASWPAGPGTLSKRTGAPVVCGYCERVAPGRFHVVLEPALDPEQFEDAHAINAAIAATTERHIREHLSQWCIFRPFWSPRSAASAAEVQPGRVHA